MFAELEAFAVEDSVPAVAAADGIEAAVQVPAAVGVGVKKFMLALVGFEVVHADAIEAAGALPDLLADSFTESRLQSDFRHLAKLADGGNTSLGQRSGVDVADAVKFFHGKRCQKSFFFAGRDHAEAARTLEPRSDGGDHFGARRANGNAQASASEYFRLQTPQRGFVIRVQAPGTGKVEVEIVQRGGFHRGRIGFEDAPHALGKI